MARLLVLALLLTLASHGARAATIEERVILDIAIRRPDSGELRHPVPVSIFRDDARRRSPFLILSHGRAPTDAERRAIGRARFTANSHYFVSLGFAVFVATRIGYGVTGGPDVEDSGACAAKQYAPVYAAAAQLTAQLLAYARARPYVEAEQGILVGQSFGGIASLALAAENPPGIRAAVNFAGGGGGRPRTHPEEPCLPDRLAALVAQYGRTTRVPTLWLYAENDRYLGRRYPRLWFDSFTRAGGRGEFVQLPPVGEDGHPSFTRNPDAWRPVFEDFLRRHALPGARAAP